MAQYAHFDNTATEDHDNKCQSEQKILFSIKQFWYQHQVSDIDHQSQFKNLDHSNEKSFSGGRIIIHPEHKPNAANQHPEKKVLQFVFKKYVPELHKLN